MSGWQVLMSCAIHVSFSVVCLWQTEHIMHRSQMLTDITLHMHDRSTCLQTPIKLHQVLATLYAFLKPVPDMSATSDLNNVHTHRLSPYCFTSKAALKLLLGASLVLAVMSMQDIYILSF